MLVFIGCNMAGVLWNNRNSRFNVELARDMRLDEREIALDRHMISELHDIISEVRDLFGNAVNLQKLLLEEMRDAVKIEKSRDPLLKKELQFVIVEENRKIEMNSNITSILKDMRDRTMNIADMCKTISKDDKVMIRIDKSIRGSSVDSIRKAM